MVGRLTLDQLVEVRILCPQPWKTPSNEGVCVRVRIPYGYAVLCPQPQQTPSQEGVSVWKAVRVATAVLSVHGMELD